MTPIISAIPAFDAIHARLCGTPASCTEAELLADLWSHGEDGWLREDPRFRRTPWGRWIPADRYLINDLIVRTLHAGASELPLQQQLHELASVTACPTAYCPADPRLTFDDDRIRLSPRELTDDPLIEPSHSVGPLLRYVTHLPVLTLKAAAASEPAGEWGPNAEPQTIEPRGWLRVEHLGRPLHPRMFVARIQGQSMQGGARPIPDGAWVIFEFTLFQGIAYDPGSHHPTVLVRGAFDDPETGAYAVKQWDRAAPEIRLISTNPDKLRFPDIVIPTDAADHVRVIATCARVLDKSDFAHRPKPLHRPGQRLLEGPSGLAEQDQRLARRIDTFFADPDLPQTEAPSEDPAPHEPLPKKTWSTRIICLTADAGGPHLELGPLPGLIAVIKKLHVVGAGWDGFLLAANARHHPDRLPVPPGSGPWRCHAVGFDDDEDLGLHRLSLDPLPTDAPTVFRVDGDGVGQRQRGATLALGQCYRLLLPPSLSERAPGDPIAGKWRLWQLDLAAPLAPEARSALSTIGLSLTEPWPRLEWALFSAAAWQNTPRGDLFPVFEPDTELILRAHGLPNADEPPSTIFLRGPNGTERLTLPQAGSALISLKNLSTGRYACALLHPRTTIPSDTLLFEIADHPTPQIPASWSIHPDRPRTVPELTPLTELTAPPGWPVTFTWRTLGQTRLATLHADRDATVDLGTVHPKIAARQSRSRIADLRIELGELGHLLLTHDRRPPLPQLREQLTQLWRQRAPLVQANPGAWSTLLPLWFRPLLELLGYTLEDRPLSAFPEQDPSIATWRLLVDERDPSQPQLHRSATRLLVLTTDLDATCERELAAVDRACTEAGVRDAILSDGLQWLAHRKSNHLRRTTWHIGQVITEQRIDEMLTELAEGL
jgi:hypothetical protein